MCRFYNHKLHNLRPVTGFRNTTSSKNEELRRAGSGDCSTTRPTWAVENRKNGQEYIRVRNSKGYSCEHVDCTERMKGCMYISPVTVRSFPPPIVCGGSAARLVLSLDSPCSRVACPLPIANRAPTTLSFSCYIQMQK